MPLVDVHLLIEERPLPRAVRRLLREAERRIERLQRESDFPAFVPSDFALVYRALQAVAETQQTRGQLFCEWGSGLGVVTCLASLLDFDAVGIEVEGELVEAAQQLAEDFDLPALFVHASFIPDDYDPFENPRDSFAWLTTSRGAAPQEWGLCLTEMDVVFVYPWPDEEKLIERLFEQGSRPGTLLMTYSESTEVQLRRKVASS